MASTTSIRKYFAVSWAWTVGLCIALLLYSEVVRYWAVAHSLVFCIAFMFPKFSRLVLPKRTTVSLALGSIVLAFAATQIIQVKNFGDVASMMLEVITGLLPITLMHRDKEVSYWISLLNTTIIAIGCMLFKGDLIVYILLIGFLGAVLFNLNSANMYMLSRGEPEQKEPLPPGFFRQFLVTIPIGILAGALIFFMFPRVKSIGLLFNIGEPNNRTGYTGEIDLQGGRNIDESSALAFTAKSDKPEWLRREGWNLFFRGTSLGVFDGKKWLASSTETMIYANQDLRINQKHDTYAQTIQMFVEPNSEEALFYPGALFSFDKLPKSVGNIFVDSQANVTRADSTNTRYYYEIQTFPIDDPHTLAKKPLNELVSAAKNQVKNNALPFQLSRESYETYTQIPDKIATAGWFIDWTEKVGINPKSATVTEAMRILKIHFQENYEASLINQFSSANTFRSFLTVDKRGHCEYFSTAAALFFRAQGLPARVVLGYRGGRFNEVAKTLEVREESAHAWTELFIQGSGWVTFDPTPLGPPTMASNSNSVVMSYISAAKFWFNRYVIDYDRGTQKDLIQSIQNLGYKKGTDQWSAVEWLKSVSFPILGSTATLVFLLYMTKFRKKRQLAAKHPAYYRYYLNLMKKRGHVRLSGESLRKFHGRMVAQHGESMHLDIGAAIESDLYSPAPLAEEARQNLLMKIKNEPKAG